MKFVGNYEINRLNNCILKILLCNKCYKMDTIFSVNVRQKCTPIVIFYFMLHFVNLKRRSFRSSVFKLKRFLFNKKFFFKKYSLLIKKFSKNLLSTNFLRFRFILFYFMESIKNLCFENLTNIYDKFFLDFVSNVPKKTVNFLRSFYSKKYSKKNPMFWFRLDIRPPTKKRARNTIFERLRFRRKLMSRYYGDVYPFTLSNYKKLRGSTFRNRTFEQKFRLFEGRLDFVLYRSSFVPSVRVARKIITSNFICINGGVISCVNYTISDNNVVTVINSKRLLMKLLFCRNIVYTVKDFGNFVFPKPDYLEYDFYIFGFIYISMLFSISKIPFVFRYKRNSILSWYKYAKY